MKKTKLFICGQKAFGAAVFEALLADGFDVLGVQAPPFRQSGGADRLRAAALRAGVGVMPPGALNARSLPSGVDLIVAAHSHDFIGMPTIRKAAIGAIGYHPSLLPRHRGRDAIRWAVHMGEAVTGGTVYWLSENTDGGPIAAQGHCLVSPNDDAESLWRRELFPLGVALVRRVVAEVDGGRITRIPQAEDLATWEPSWARPPLHKPELLQIGEVAGFESVTHKSQIS